MRGSPRRSASLWREPFAVRCALHREPILHCSPPNLGSDIFEHLVIPDSTSFTFVDGDHERFLRVRALSHTFSSKNNPSFIMISIFARKKVAYLASFAITILYLTSVCSEVESVSLESSYLFCSSIFLLLFERLFLFIFTAHPGLFHIFP